MLTRALQRTAGLWPPIKDAYALVYQAAHILANHEQQTGAQVRETYLVWVKHMQEQKASLGTLSTTIDHFVEKTANFAPGLFHCYDVANLQPSDYQVWRQLRTQLRYREEARRKQFRFRKDPAAYLAALETQLLE